MQVFEPCNYASNVAYYHSATRICDYPDFSVDDTNQLALKRSFTTLAMGSAFWHGSHTYDGYSFDNNMIAVISYLAHQASVSYLPASSVLTELSSTPRTKTGIQVSDDLTTMFYEKKVDEWAEVLDTCDIPHEYYITFAAIFSTVSSVMFPWLVVEHLINGLCGFLIPPADAAFIKNEYLPALKPAVANIKVSSSDVMDLAKKVAGVLIKIAYAFVWQEFFVPLPFLYNSLGLHIGAWLSVPINHFASELSGYPQTDKYVTSGKNLYPGQDKCKVSSAHALWHEESANGFLEIVLLADTVHKYTKQQF